MAAVRAVAGCDKKRRTPMTKGMALLERGVIIYFSLYHIQWDLSNAQKRKLEVGGSLRLNYFENTKDHVDKMGAAYSATLTGK